MHACIIAAMAMAMASTTGRMAPCCAVVSNNSPCPSSSLAPFPFGAVKFGSSSSAISAEGLSFGSGKETRGGCFKRFAKFQQFSQDAADGSLVEDGGEEEMEEDSADQYVHIEFSTSCGWIVYDEIYVCKIVLVTFFL